MAVALQAYAAQSDGYGAGNVTLVPATTDLVTGTWTVADGDVIVMMVGMGEATGAPVPNTTGDWTQLESSSAAMQVGAWYHVVSGTTNPDYQVNKSGSSSTGIGAWLLRGADVAAIDSALIDQYSTANLNPASVTCPGDGSAVLVCGWRFDGGAGATPPTGYTERSDLVPEAGFLDPFYACDKFSVGHGTEDPGVITNSGTTNQTAITVAVGAVDRTVTVHKTTGDYSTVQSAIDDCSVYIASGWYKVEITDAAEYDEEISIPAAEITTPTASHYLWLTAASGVRHAGVAGTGHARILNNASTDGVIIDLSYTRVDWLELNRTATTTEKNNVSINPNASSTVGVLISYCIIRAAYSTANYIALVMLFGRGKTGPVSASVDNCVLYGAASAGVNVSQWDSGSSNGPTMTLNVDHCTVVDNGIGSDGEGAAVINTAAHANDTETLNVYNTAGAKTNSGADDFRTLGTVSGTVTWNGSHNLHASEVNELGGTDNTTNWQNATGDATVTTTTANAAIFTNLTHSSEDYTPVAATGAGSNLLLTNGTDRIGSEPDSRQDFSLDIAGNTRPTANVDIGAFQISSGAATTELQATRWFDDDGSETTATALAAQDVAITGRAAETNTRLRVQIQTTGDVASGDYTVQYRKVGDADSEWENLA